ncbi:MAG: ABC transporter permease [Bacteroidota bacterium]
MLLRLTILELQRIAARPRSYISFGAIALVSLLIQFAMYADGKEYIRFITQAAEQSFFFEGEILNGNLICFIILQMLIIQVPLLVALVTGDAISGEAAMGTLRFLLTRPVSRTSVILSKFLAGAVYTFLLLVWLGILSLGIGLLMFGPGDLIVLKTEELIILPGADVLWRFFAALGMAFLALLLIGALSLMLSCFSDNSIGPIITTMAIVILFTIIGTLEVPIFDKMKPFLFTTHMSVWRSFFEDPLPVNEIRSSVILLLTHIAAFLSIALYRFNRKDILS